MPFASGIFKRLVVSKETTWGTKPSATTGRQLNRVESTISLVKDAFESRSMASHQQVVDYRHGRRRVEGSISGELQANGFTELWAALLRAAWTTGVTTSAATVTVNNTARTITRSSGSWLADGLRVGDVIRSTNFANSGNNNRNIRIVALTATQITYGDETTLTNETNTANVTFSVPGRKLVLPSSGHTDDSFTIEHWHADVPWSQRFVGCKVTGARVSLPPNGFATVQFDILGKDAETGTSAYFTSPAAAPTTPMFSSAVGKVRMGSSDVGLVTSMEINIAGGHTVAEAVATSTPPQIFPGRVRVSGNLSVYFENASLYDAFDQESEVGVYFHLFSSSLGNADVFAIKMPRVKVGGFTMNDVEQGIVASGPFQALLPSSGTDIDVTTIALQDTQAT